MVHAIIYPKAPLIFSYYFSYFSSSFDYFFTFIFSYFKVIAQVLMILNNLINLPIPLKPNLPWIIDWNLIYPYTLNDKLNTFLMLFTFSKIYPMVFVVFTLLKVHFVRTLTLFLMLLQLLLSLEYMNLVKRALKFCFIHWNFYRLQKLNIYIYINENQFDIRSLLFKLLMKNIIFGVLES